MYRGFCSAPPSLTIDGHATIFFLLFRWSPPAAAAWSLASAIARVVKVIRRKIKVPRYGHVRHRGLPADTIDSSVVLTHGHVEIAVSEFSGFHFYFYRRRADTMDSMIEASFRFRASRTVSRSIRPQSIDQSPRAARVVGDLLAPKLFFGKRYEFLRVHVCREAPFEKNSARLSVE